MANDGFSKRNDGTWEHDAAAFLPEPEGYLTIAGHQYPIYSFLDLPVEESMMVVRIGEDIDNAPDLKTRLDRSIDQLLALNAGPDAGRSERRALTREMLEKLTARQIVGLVVMANSIAAVPQKADESASRSESPSSAPASADSTVGVTAS
jgi:hypothetical protein